MHPDFATIRPTSDEYDEPSSGRHVRDNLDTLDKRAQRVSDTAHRLVDRLADVLGPELSEKAEIGRPVVVDSAESPVAGELRSIGRRLDELADFLAEVTERLDV